MISDDEKKEIAEKYKKCIFSLSKKEERTNKDLYNIQQYLHTLTFFKRLRVYNPANVDSIVEKISKVIKFNPIQKDEYVTKFGQKENLFYLILQGKVSIIVVEYRKVNLKVEEYLIFLLKLFNYKEFELLKETISANYHILPVENNFEKYIKKLYIKQVKLYNKKYNIKSHINLKTEYKNKNDVKNKIRKTNSRNSLSTEKIDPKTMTKRQNNFFNKNNTNYKVTNEESDDSSESELDLENCVLYNEILLRKIEEVFPELLPEDKIIKITKNKNKKKNNNELGNNITPEKLMLFVNLDGTSSVEKDKKRSYKIPFYVQNNIFTTGKYFGQKALESNKKSALTIITLEDCNFGVLEKEDYFNLLSNIHKELVINFYSTLYKVSFFCCMPKGTFDHYYSSFFEYRSFEIKKLVYARGVKTDLLYLLRGGKFSILIKGNMIDLNSILIGLKTMKYYRENLKKNSLKYDQYKNLLTLPEKEENEDMIYNKKFKCDEFSKSMYSNMKLI